MNKDKYWLLNANIFRFFFIFFYKLTQNKLDRIKRFDVDNSERRSLDKQVIYDYDLTEPGAEPGGVEGAIAPPSSAKK